REAPNEEPAGGEQDERERDLDGDERRLEPLAGRARASRRGALERRNDLRARGGERRHQAEEDRGRNRRDERPREDAPVDDRMDERRSVEARQQDVEQPGGDDDAGGGAERRQEDAFGQKLSHDPPARRADGETNPDLPPATRGAAEEEVGDVC